MVNSSAQIETPTGMTDTECERRYQMREQLTLKSWFKDFFYYIFQQPVIKAKISKGEM